MKIKIVNDDDDDEKARRKISMEMEILFSHEFSFILLYRVYTK
jgi:hypothetical protein